MAFGLRGSGRAALGQGALFCNFFGRRFCVQNGHLDAAQTYKNIWFWDTLCAKGGAQKSLEVSLVLPKASVFPSFIANSGGRLSGQNGPVDTLLNWLCCLGGVGGVFLLVFVQGFSTKVASWLRYLGGMACAFSIIMQGFCIKVAKLNMSKKEKFHFRTRILYKKSPDKGRLAGWLQTGRLVADWLAAWVAGCLAGS